MAGKTGRESKDGQRWFVELHQPRDSDLGLTIGAVSSTGVAPVVGRVGDSALEQTIGTANAGFAVRQPDRCEAIGMANPRIEIQV